MSISNDLNELTKPINEIAVPISNSIGHTLQDVWDLVFGGFGGFVEKKRIKRLKNIEDFRASLESKISEIPERNLQEPSIAIIGPALESSKYYFEETQIREMFAELIAAAADNRRSTLIHRSFVRMIEQMSPVDADNLSLFHDVGTVLPIAEYRIRSRSKTYSILETNVFLENEKYMDIVQQSQSISSLERLGLVAVDYGNHLYDNHKYDKYRETNLYKEYENSIRQYRSNDIMIVAPGVVKMTPLGEAFRSICLPDSLE